MNHDWVSNWVRLGLQPNQKKRRIYISKKTPPAKRGATDILNCKPMQAAPPMSLCVFMPHLFKCSFRHEWMEEKVRVATWHFDFDVAIYLHSGVASNVTLRLAHFFTGSPSVCSVPAPHKQQDFRHCGLPPAAAATAHFFTFMLLILKNYLVIDLHAVLTQLLATILACDAIVYVVKLKKKCQEWVPTCCFAFTKMHIVTERCMPVKWIKDTFPFLVTKSRSEQSMRYQRKMYFKNSFCLLDTIIMNTWSNCKESVDVISSNYWSQQVVFCPLHTCMIIATNNISLDVIWH